MSFEFMPASFIMRAAVEFTSIKASSIGSTLTNWSPHRFEMSCAFTSTWLASFERYGCPP